MLLIGIIIGCILICILLILISPFLSWYFNSLFDGYGNRLRRRNNVGKIMWPGSRWLGQEGPWYMWLQLWGSSLWVVLPPSGTWGSASFLDSATGDGVSQAPRVPGLGSQATAEARAEAARFFQLTQLCAVSSLTLWGCKYPERVLGGWGGQDAGGRVGKCVLSLPSLKPWLP